VSSFVVAIVLVIIFGSPCLSTLYLMRLSTYKYDGLSVYVLKMLRSMRRGYKITDKKGFGVISQVAAISEFSMPPYIPSRMIKRRFSCP